jgi:hypothetical protein
MKDTEELTESCERPMISERCGRISAHLGGASSSSRLVLGRPVCSRRRSGTTGMP